MTRQSHWRVATLTAAALLAQLIGCGATEAESRDPHSGGAAGSGGAGEGAGSGGTSGSGAQGGYRCDFTGVYEPLALEIAEGACDIAVTATEFAIRELPSGGLGVSFDATDWESIVVNDDDCSFTARTAGLWLWNDTARVRTLSVTIAGGVLQGEMTDVLDGQDSQGRTCDVRYRFSAPRSSKPPPMGEPLGAYCGGLSCTSGSRCAYGNMPVCESGLCLFDTTIDPWDVICTQPCSDSAPCPDGFMCLAAAEAYDTDEGSYCARYRPICGNNTPEAGEECDDGDTEGGDGCSASCVVEGCGNTLIDVGEDCDPSVGESPLPCTASCTYDLPAGAHGVVPRISAALRGMRLAALSDGNLVVAWMTSDFDQQHDEVWMRRLSSHGAGKDVPVLVTSGQLRDTFELAGSGSGAVLLVQDQFAPRVFVTDPNGGNPREVAAFPPNTGSIGDPTFVLSDGARLAVRGARDAIFAEGWFAGDGSHPIAVRGVRGTPQIVRATKSDSCYSSPHGLGFTLTGDLGVVWEQSCETHPLYVSVLGASAAAFTPPVAIPTSDDGSSLWPVTMVSGTAVPLVIVERKVEQVTQALLLGRYAAGNWSFAETPVAAAQHEQMVDAHAAPDGSLAILATRTPEGGVWGADGEVRYARETSPGQLTFETLLPGWAQSIGFDAAGTAHVLFRSQTASELMHLRISSTGQVGVPESLWVSSLFQKATSEDGDFYVLDESRGVLFRLQ